MDENAGGRHDAQDAQLFRDLHDAVLTDLERFVRRRVAPSAAEDVVADVLLVVWRRLADLPADRDARRAWVFGIARNTLLTARRGERRREALAVRVGTERGGQESVVDDPEVLARRLDLVRAWPRLSAEDQEVLALTYWEDLTSAHAAAVLGVTPVALRLRLTRARRRLRRHLDPTVPGPSPSPSALAEGRTP
ncbi:sigma-70 family RNA polymerase sigma factor [Phycicoccus sp. BSK3Z-2]|uniref:Sigma-70 family RNA polymerase sigma factor n=1 Tax=Phycicoccus avicenniae TaxID=2828860 RepID=A0A941DA29_9MICO|nr:sigma-70 family RNA polymerase sigma factor [Phycicoccus avicenniae]MBR7744884.1 sigma-70 family RNA polymerase sigma factor [Phycicoccus avicenniae]